MEPIVKKLIQADLHQITTAWSEGRVTSPEKVKNLAAAMAQEGQQVPLVAVAEKDQLMLLDGYARLDAARQCGWDQAWVEVWSCGLKTGLCVFRSKRPPNSAKAATLEIGGRRIALFILSGRFDQVHIGFLLRLDTPDRGGLFTVFSLRLSYSFSDAVSKGCARVLRLDSPLRAIR